VATDTATEPVEATQPKSSVVSLIERLAEIGARPQDSRDDRLRAGALILAASAIALLSFVWIVTYAAYGHVVSAAIPALYQVLTLSGLIMLARSKRFDVFRTFQLAAFISLPVLLQISLGGFVPSSGIVLWCTVAPLTALALVGLRRSLPWLVAFFTVVIALAILESHLPVDPALLPAGIILAFFVMNISGTMLGSFVLLGYYVHQSELARAALAAERERSERLLLNVLPEPIAERLKAEEGVIAERHDAVTVLFADLVGFTEHTAGMPAEDLVRLLDEIFSTFDRLVDAEGLEKIKTIGDAYMVAGGLPEPRDDHAEAVARVALAMRREVAAIAGRGRDPWLKIRIGIDSGPVVAGVIGHRKFIYDIWGDTVNTASRMESHGLPGEIQVTSRLSVQLKDSFVLEPRGAIDVKGKGRMETFLLRKTP
jgi:adenylate cyclase